MVDGIERGDRVRVLRGIHSRGVRVAAQRAVDVRDGRAVSVHAVRDDTDVVSCRVPREVDLIREHVRGVQVRRCAGRRRVREERRAEHHVVEGNVERAAGRRVTELDSPERTRTERVCLRRDHLHAVQPQVDLTRVAVQQHMELQFVPQILRDDLVRGRDGRVRVIAVGKFAGVCDEHRCECAVRRRA